MLKNQQVFEIFIVLYNKYNESFKIEDIQRHEKVLIDFLKNIKRKNKEFYAFNFGEVIDLDFLFFKYEDIKKNKDKHMKELKEVFQSCKESNKNKKIKI